MRTCTKCGEEKPLGAFSRYATGRPGTSDVCSGCRAVQAAEKRAYLREYRRRHFEKNREKELAQMAEWRRQNAERKSAADKAYRAANHEKVKERQRDYNRANRDKSNARVRKFHLLNPEKVRHWGAVGRARRRNAGGGGVTVAQWREKLRDSLGLCSYCWQPMERPTLDHIEPIARGGEHDVDNITPACRFCNFSKSDTPLLMWMARRALAKRRSQVAA